MTLEDLEKKLAALRASRNEAESRAIACVLVGDLPAAQANCDEANALQPEIGKLYKKIKLRIS